MIVIFGDSFVHLFEIVVIINSFILFLVILIIYSYLSYLVLVANLSFIDYLYVIIEITFFICIFYYLNLLSKIILSIKHCLFCIFCSINLVFAFIMNNY